MKYTLKKIDKEGIRIGELTTTQGVINTPFFMPVGTVGSVKGVSPQELRELGAQIVLSNTYHLYLRPGEKLIKKLGGLHEFMRWDGPILTDSGGYQVFSLGERKYKSEFLISNVKTNLKSQTTKDTILKAGSSKLKANKSLVKITEDGVEFTSHLDGSKHFFTPEKVIDIQLDLGVDILMPLDVCPSGKASRKEIEDAVELTIEWAKRAKKHFDQKNQKSKIKKLTNKENIKLSNSQKLQATSYKLQPEAPALFGIIQGGLDPELRKYCAEELIKLNFDGYAIGGLAVDHETRDMWQTVRLMGEMLPENKPRYLMGVGTPDDIQKAMRLGVDMFDCVLPTRLARHGAVYVHKEQVESKKLKVKSISGNFELINLLNSKYRTDRGVIEEGCDCPACKGGFSRAYISHLIRNNEIMGLRLASLHNLREYLKIMANVRIER